MWQQWKTEWMDQKAVLDLSFERFDSGSLEHVNMVSWRINPREQQLLITYFQTSLITWWRWWWWWWRQCKTIWITAIDHEVPSAIPFSANHPSGNNCTCQILHNEQYTFAQIKTSKIGMLCPCNNNRKSVISLLIC